MYPRNWYHMTSQMSIDQHQVRLRYAPTQEQSFPAHPKHFRTRQLYSYRICISSHKAIEKRAGAVESQRGSQVYRRVRNFQSSNFFYKSRVVQSEAQRLFHTKEEQL